MDAKALRRSPARSLNRRDCWYGRWYGLWGWWYWVLCILGKKLIVGGGWPWTGWGLAVGWPQMICIFLRVLSSASWLGLPPPSPGQPRPARGQALHSSRPLLPSCLPAVTLSSCRLEWVVRSKVSFTCGRIFLGGWGHLQERGSEKGGVTPWKSLVMGMKLSTCLMKICRTKTKGGQSIDYLLIRKSEFLMEFMLPSLLI